MRGSSIMSFIQAHKVKALQAISRQRDQGNYCRGELKWLMAQEMADEFGR